MTQPIWIDCASMADVDSPEQLAAQTSGGHHVVLRFPTLRSDEISGLINRLSAALPDYSVFDSGGNLSPAQVTIMPVVARARVLDRRSEVLGAIAEYHQACAVLVDQYRAGALPPEWRADEHGGECRFTSRRTGQVVEAPFQDWVVREQVDPYFFAEFVKTTPGLESVAELIEHKFHDGRRILDVVATES